MKRLLVVLLVVTMLFGTGTAESQVPIELSKAGEEREIVSLRTENSDTYLLPDGTYKSVLYSYAKYFLNGDEEYQVIDNSIIPTSYDDGITEYTYENNADDYHVFFADKATPQILISHRGRSLSFSVVGYNYTEADIGESLLSDAIPGEVELGSNSIKYPNLLNGIDYYYVAEHRLVKELIVIKERPMSPLSEFVFNVSHPGCNVVINDDGTICFVDSETQEEVFRLANLFAIDSCGAYCNDLTYSLYELDANTSTITFQIPVAFYLDESRVYPILIDPSVLISGSSSTYDTCVDQQYPTSNYYLSESLWTGGQLGSNAMRALIRFDLPSSISASQLTRASLRIRKKEHQSPSIVANRITSSWTSNTATWNNQPGYTSFGCSDVCHAEGSDWYGMDVTTIVYNWLNGSYSNYGFLLREQSESSSSQKTKYYSSDSGYPNRPELVLYYVNNIGSRKYQQAPSDLYVNPPRTNCMGYALEINAWIDNDTLGIVENDMVGMNKEQMLNYIAGKIEIWMTNNNNIGSGNYSVLSAYDSNINTSSPGWYRVALRVGLDDDVTVNNKYDLGEHFGFHWRYQTTSGHGLWADKPGNLPSIKRADTNGKDPGASYWNSMVMTYSSSVKYYQIKDLRTVPEWEEE